MEYKVLEQNGIENENVDGAAFNNFCAGDKDGIIKGILDECKVYSPSSNSIAISTGEIIVKGFRVKITDPYLYSFVANAGVAIRYHIVAILTLSLDRSVTISIICRPVKNLVKDEIFKVEQGIYELELVRFTHTSTGITDIVKTVDVIAGCSAKSSGIIIGNVKTENIPAEMEAEVDVENVIRNGRTETDFTFSIPKSSITVDNLLLLDSENPVQNKVVTEELNNKLDKVIPNTQSAYVATANGEQKMIPVASGYPNPNSIALRGTRGELLVVTTSIEGDLHAVNKKYLAEKIELAKEEISSGDVWKTATLSIGNIWGGEDNADIVGNYYSIDLSAEEGENIVNTYWVKGCIFAGLLEYDTIRGVQIDFIATPNYEDLVEFGEYKFGFKVEGNKINIYPPYYTFIEQDWLFEFSIIKYKKF